jgi:hypothetical protein
MKTTKYFFFILFTFFLMNCSKKLETNPTSFFSQDNYWTSSQHVLDALAGCYQSLAKGIFDGSNEFQLENLTPNSFYNGTGDAIVEFVEGRQTATTLGINSRTWSNCYKGIGRCNTVLDNIEKVDMDKNLSSRIIGEAKFLRAFLYQRLNIVFHGVPLILNEPNIETDAKLPRNTYEEVLTQVLKDLDDAIAVLPVSYPKTDDGRITKGAALSMKARVLLQEKKYPEVVNLCKEVFGLNVYDLFPDYGGVFKKANEGNEEIIFDVRYKAPDLTNGDYNIIFAQFQTMSPTRELVDAYEMKDGLTIDKSPLYDPDHPYENRDPRFKQTILYIGMPWRNRTATAADLHQSGYGFWKSTEYNATTQGTIPPDQSDDNFIVIRFADVLLMYAEALNEVSGPVPDVYSSINKVRQRPSVNMPPLPSGLSQEEMREIIRHERRIELAGEARYFFDIRRWKTIEDVMNQSVYDYKNNLLQKRSFNPARDYFWPIPFTEIDLNPNLKQNTGY